MALRDAGGNNVGGVNGAGVGGDDDRFSPLNTRRSEVLCRSSRTSTSSPPMASSNAGGGDVGGVDGTGVDGDDDHFSFLKARRFEIFQELRYHPLAQLARVDVLVAHGLA